MADVPGSAPTPSARRGALRSLLTLAAPVVAAELGWMAMGIVDTLMVAPLGPAAIGAVSVGSMLFMAVGVFGMGLLLGLDPVVAQAHGGGRLRDCHAWLVQGAWLGLAVAVPVSVLVELGSGQLAVFRVHEAVLGLATPYLRVINLSLVPLLLYAACRRYLQGMGHGVPITLALVAANGVNVLANWSLVYGHLGAPAMGTQGAAWATVLSRGCLVVTLIAAIAWYDRRDGTRLRETALAPDADRLRHLLVLGVPAAIQLTLEVGVFAAATTLASRLAPTALAAHHIALNIASVTFMVPLGVASAGAVRVGQALGRADATGASRAGWSAIGVVLAFMSVAAAVFVLWPEFLISRFTTDAGILRTGVTLLFVAALFQLFDGMQVVATGVLRGLGETRVPMLWNLAGHWALGLPVGYVLCFHAGWGVVGLWVGLSIGLTIVGLVLVRTWADRARRLTAAPRSGARADRPGVPSAVDRGGGEVPELDASPREALRWDPSSRSTP